MYHVYMSSLYTYRVYELTKFIKNLKQFIRALFILLYMCIKFQREIPNNKGVVKKTKFLTDQKYVRNFSFLLQIKYNKFNLEILYTDGVGWKKHV
jgi:hypothetical protein